MNNQRFLSQDDASTLSTLAEHMLRTQDARMNFAEDLVELVSTSILLPENARRNDCVALYTAVTYRVVGSGELHSIHIVSPHDHNAALARISILAPLAMSLVGRPVGSIVEVSLPFDKQQRVEIVAIEPRLSVANEPNARPAGGQETRSSGMQSKRGMRG
ncbi:GreA/GreB family elongation factor [Noviherbaspirillum sp.]|uniref:GreA/GreB family elongation factor n=1 Tax=Noviherbaspirillum sp. TaxID=1926288 RepID=UPI002B4753E1|nr:GreA/GreB family elongation factor [Noviherbaspirillum sp.]HJV80274.1 GreA/GreB family elongation factor [Noviherbaspirillum sp.]